MTMAAASIAIALRLALQNPALPALPLYVPSTDRWTPDRNLPPRARGGMFLVSCARARGARAPAGRAGPGRSLVAAS